MVALRELGVKVALFDKIGVSEKGMGVFTRKGGHGKISGY